MKNKMLLIFSIFFCFGLADEFVESKTSLGGYGEMHYDMEGDGELDFHRFIFYIKHNFNDMWSLMSEVEIEHNMVGSEAALGTSVGKGGYVAMEQAHLNYWNGKWGFQGGVLLIPAGIINEYHEPPTFMSVERPTYHSKIIPTTWFDNGFAFYGTMGDFNWKFAMTGDLNGDMINTSKGLKDARRKGSDSSTTDWLKSFQMSWTGIDGLKLGGSYHMNDAPFSGESVVPGVDAHWAYETTHNGYTPPSCDAGDYYTSDDCTNATWDHDGDGSDGTDGGTAPQNGQWTELTDNGSTTTATWVESTEDTGMDRPEGVVGVKLMEVNGTYSKNNMYARFEYGKVDYENGPMESSSGYYLDLGYNIANMVGCDDDLYVWMRNSAYNMTDTGDDTEISLFGVMYKPHDRVSLKFETGESGDNDVMRMGLGYMF